MQNINGGSLLKVNEIFKKAAITERMRIADLGCGGMGHFVFSAAKFVGNNGKVFAVDILKNVLENIKRRSKQENIENIKTVWSDLEIFNGTKIESNSLDAGLLINILHQSKKRVEILRETIRMIKKRGKMVIVEWKKSSAPFGPIAQERIDPEVLKNAAGKLGLKFEDEFDAGQYHYGLIFTKL